MLTGSTSADKTSFAGEIAVQVTGGTSVAQKVNLSFGRLPDDAGAGRFEVAWRACEHEGLFPVFGGDLEIHPNGTGSLLRLAGHYCPPLGAVGAFGDGLIVHRVARRSLHGFLEAVAGRIDAWATRELVAVAAAPPAADHAEPVADETGSELYLG